MADTRSNQGPDESRSFQRKGPPSSVNGASVAGGVCTLCNRPLDDHTFRDPRSYHWLEQPYCVPRPAPSR